MVQNLKNNKRFQGYYEGETLVSVKDTYTGKNMNILDMLECLNNLYESHENYKNDTLLKVLQKHYDYADNQRQKNLDNVIVYRAYDVLRYTVYDISRELDVPIDRFKRNNQDLV